MAANLGRRFDVDPLVSFSFVVSIDGINVARFNGVDGLAYEAEMIEYRDSSEPHVVMYRQGRRKAPRVTLKRGVLVGSKSNDLLNWIREIENGAISKRNIVIEIGSYGSLDETDGSEHRAWQLLNCMPAKWSLGALDSNSNSALLETLELVVEEIRQA